MVTRVRGTVRPSGRLTGMVTHEVSTPRRLPDYDGPYEAAPTAEGETLPTSGRSMARDMAILPIPYGAVENSAGGVTVSIAS